MQENHDSRGNLKSGISDDDWMIVLFATAGVSEFIENSLQGIRACGIDPGLVHVVIPMNAADELSALVRKFGAVPRVLEDVISSDCIGNTLRGYVDYGTPEFNHLMRVRFRILRALLCETKRIISADIDIAWFRNPLPYLSKVLTRYPWACQTEAVAAFPPNFCVGFFALLATQECLELIDAHIAMFSSDRASPTLTMQQTFNQLIKDQPKYLSMLFPLPEALFSNGLLYSSIKARDAAQDTECH